MSVDKQLIERFKKSYITNSRMRENVVIQSEDEQYLSSLMAKTSESTQPFRVDDGISGLRYALILKSVDLEGEHQICDPGIIDVGSALKNGAASTAEPISARLHYGIPAGTTGTIVKDSDDVGELFRFY